MKDQDRPLFAISIVAQMLGVHPQTLRLYEREGLISPSRTKGKTRLYSERDVEQLKFILHLIQDLRLNLAGVGLFLEMQQKIDEMQGEMERTFERLQEGLEIETHHTEKSKKPGAARPHPQKPIKIKIEQG